ncbi:Reverse transcriptase-RNase H-integrase [Mycena sanguinolenta]|uniref:Reverse transcriptase-RNase H-integrase n=1 Tax=Mycena sanguinolenta TaxID=230812 RepID=A0A8H7DHW6_9AGAR|nr:Reverse transcriptase-RNase H-integrase [Mycena sanguinolenta]
MDQSSTSDAPEVLEATAVEAHLDRLEGLLERFLQHTVNSAPAPTPAPAPPAPGPVGGPGLFENVHPTAKSVLRPNSLFVFDGDCTKGRSFLHSVRQYARLLPEAFLDAGEPSEEKVVRFAMTYMSNGAAQRWVERQCDKTIFPFDTWDAFVQEFRLRFVGENEQDHALQKLESRDYYMGTRDIFAYMDDFEDLAALAGYTDPLSLLRAAPRPPPPVPMDVDCTHACFGSGPQRCYRCGEPGHLANACTAPADVRVTDVLDEVIHQLGGDLLEELVVHVTTSSSVLESDMLEALEGFVRCDDMNSRVKDTPPEPVSPQTLPALGTSHLGVQRLPEAGPTVQHFGLDPLLEACAPSRPPRPGPARTRTGPGSQPGPLEDSLGTTPYGLGQLPEVCLPSQLPQPSPVRKPGWERRLSKHYIAAALPGGNSLQLPLELESVDNAIKNQAFLFGRLSQPIPIFNVDGFPNEAGAITEVADVVLRYNGHSERVYIIRKSTGKPGRGGVKLGGDEDDPPLEDKDRILYTWFSPPASIRATATVSQRLAEAFAKNSTPAGASIPEWACEFGDVLSKESFDSLPEHRSWDHAIELVPDAKPANCKVYPISPLEQKELDAFIEEGLATGCIHPSKSPMASPVFFVKKKDRGLQFVQDYRALNAMTVKNRYPLPLINDLINWLKGAWFFMKLDVWWGFNNTMMNDIFQDLILSGDVMVYLDDILIAHSNCATHRKVVAEVLQRLRQHKLFLWPEKCEFEQTSIEYLGVIISHNCVEMDPVKVAGIATWPSPENKRNVQQFLGFTNFYRRFIGGFSDIACPLFDLTKKGAAWVWGPSEERAFQGLKDALTSDPVLLLPDPTKTLSGGGRQL